MPQVREKLQVTELVKTLEDLLSDRQKRNALGTHAHEVMKNNRGAVARTLEYLTPLLEKREHQ